MTELKVFQFSDMDEKLEAAFKCTEGDRIWAIFIKSLQYVKDAKWDPRYADSDSEAYTLITFETEEDKLMFILRWS